MELGYIAAADVVIQVFFTRVQVYVYTSATLLLPFLVGLQPTWYVLSIVFYHLPVGLFEDFCYLFVVAYDMLVRYYCR